MVVIKVFRFCQFLFQRVSFFLPFLPCTPTICVQYRVPSCGALQLICKDVWPLARVYHADLHCFDCNQKNIWAKLSEQDVLPCILIADVTYIEGPAAGCPVRLQHHVDNTRHWRGRRLSGCLLTEVEPLNTALFITRPCTWTDQGLQTAHNNWQCVS